MKAVWIETYGGPEALIRGEAPIPALGPGMVLVRLHYSGINFMDVHTRQGKYKTSTTYPVRLPTGLGIEGAGIVEATGAGVEDFRPGDRVAYCLCWGSYAEFAAVPADRLVHVPDAVSLESAAAVLFHGLTAHYLAYDIGRLGPGMTCLVHAASGGIGQILVQLGVRLGATVLATTSSEKKADLVRARGAHHVIAYDGGQFAERVRELTAGRGADVIFDPIGQPTFRDSLRAARKKGLIISFGSVGGSIRDIDPIELGEAGSLFLTRPRLADYLDGPEVMRGRAADIFLALSEGALSVAISGTYTLDTVESAHDDLEHRTILGKPLVKIR